jgi:hypothetical protein
MKSLLLGYDANRRAVRLSPEDRKIHAHVIGSSGSGKSRFLEWMIRGDLRNQQGFCLIDPHGELYDEVVAYAAHRVLDREIILLNLSEPGSVVGFNPFRRHPEGDISVQVDRRVTATMHAWGVPNADQTPTLARTLRLIYTVMLEQNLGLPQVQHLLDFNAKDVRGLLIDRVQTPLIRSEWQELHQLKARDFRDEILSAKNRLFKILTSTGLNRFMGLPDVSINLREVMDQGKVLLVNLKQSKHLSHEGARTFGALLVNEFFEAALERRKDRGRDPKPYYLYLDEFQNFVSLDIARMLAEVRKFGLFLVLAHQYAEQLEEDLFTAALNNCQIKAVFGGLSVSNARRMAEELFIGKLDPKKIKASIYQTKFWPEYRRDKAYGKSSSTGHAHGTMESSASATFSGMASGETFFTADNWFGSGTGPMGSSEVSSSGSTATSGSGYSDMHSDSSSESEVDIPIFFPVPFQELSSVQYYSLEEQLTELTGALKNQFQRHCFIQIRQQETQPMLVPFVDPVTTFTYNRRNLDWYIDQQHKKQGALPAAEVDRLLIEQESSLLQTINVARPSEELPMEEPAAAAEPQPERKSRTPIWSRDGGSNIWNVPTEKSDKPQRKRGPKPDTENHQRVAAIIRRYDDDWILDDNLLEICEALDAQHVPIPKKWPSRTDGKSHSWSRGLQNYPTLVIKAIKDRLKAAEAHTAKAGES